MSGTTSRVLHLLELLESAGMRTLRELSERLDVDERTVRRYIERLRDMDIRIESLRGRYGGYRLTTGLRMPPLMLTNDEALAVFLGLLYAQSAPGTPKAEAQTAMSKARRSLPAETARRLEVLLQTAVFAEAPASDIPGAEILLTVADAIESRCPIEVRYASASGRRTPRTLHPAEIVVYSGRWYVVAHDVDADAERTFRLDRVRSVRRLAGTFAAPERAANPVQRLIDGFAQAERAWHVILRVHADEPHIREHLPASVATIEQLSGSADPSPWRRVEIHAERLDWLPAAIIGLDCPIQVEAPEELRTLLRHTAARLNTAADPGEFSPPEPR